jgi:hypothetical protein
VPAPGAEPGGGVLGWWRRQRGRRGGLVGQRLERAKRGIALVLEREDRGADAQLVAIGEAPLRHATLGDEDAILAAEVAEQNALGVDHELGVLARRVAVGERHVGRLRTTEHHARRWRRQLERAARVGAVRDDEAARRAWLARAHGAEQALGDRRRVLARGARRSPARSRRSAA